MLKKNAFESGILFQTDLTDDNLLVHCLDKSLSEGMDDSVFVRLLQKMEEI